MRVFCMDGRTNVMIDRGCCIYTRRIFQKLEAFWRYRTSVSGHCTQSNFSKAVSASKCFASFAGIL